MAFNPESASSAAAAAASSAAASGAASPASDVPGSVARYPECGSSASAIDDVDFIDDLKVCLSSLLTATTTAAHCMDHVL